MFISSACNQYYKASVNRGADAGDSEWLPQRESHSRRPSWSIQGTFTHNTITCRDITKAAWSRLRILWTRQHLLPRSWPGKFCNIFLIADCFSLNYWHQHQHRKTIILSMINDDHSRQPWVHVAEVAKVKDGKGGIFGKHSVHLLCLERFFCHLILKSTSHLFFVKTFIVEHCEGPPCKSVCIPDMIGYVYCQRHKGWVLSLKQLFLSHSTTSHFQKEMEL